SAIAGSGADPTVGGGTLTLYNPTTLETARIDLPKGHWKALGKPRGTGGYKYSDKDLADGPCKKVLVKPGKLLKALGLREQLAFTLDENLGQGSLAVKFSSGDAGTISSCLVFGGTITRDKPATPLGVTGVFKAKDAPAPMTCPIP